MSNLQQELRDRAKTLLESGEITYLIGWGETRFANRTKPEFACKAGDAEKLVYNEYCVNNTAKYLLDDKYPDGKIGVCVRGCDSRAVNRLVKDGAVKRENLYLIGLPCEGKKEPDGHTAEKCTLCTHRNPLVYDELLGDPVPEQEVAGRFDQVDELEAMDADSRYTYWSEEFDKCIRCYACRNVCPACNCVECFVEQYRTGWQGKQNNRAENQVYGMTRAYHIGDRCIECGECERVCPMNIPLMKLNRKLVKDVNELFGDYEGGLDSESTPALGAYMKEDVEEFM